MNDDEQKISPKEALIREKMRAGLSRAQAEEVIANQEAHDAELAKQARPAEPAKEPEPAKAPEPVKTPAKK